jgi:pilus assembly protein CpaB
MGNLKKLLSNKNVVTLLGAILIVVVLYLFYNWRVESAVQPVSIPYALHSIEPQTLITNEDMATVEVAQSSLKGNVTYSAAEVSGKYSTSFIPAGGFFYRDANYSEVGSLPNKYLYENIKEGLIAFNYKVDVTTTFGNSFFPGKYFDIYVKIVIDKENNKILFGKLVSNLKVAAVRDASGRDVFAASDEVRSPSQIVFGVDEETNVLLRGTEKLAEDGEIVEIILVPTAFDKLIEKDETKKEEEAQIVRGKVEEWLYKEGKIEQVASDNVPQDGNNPQNNDDQNINQDDSQNNPNDDNPEENG